MADQKTPSSRRPIRPQPIEVGMSASGLLETTFLGSTAGLLAEAAYLLTRRILVRADTLVGLSLDAPIISSGMGISALIPLLEGGYVDWLSVTGSNLYYDALIALRKPLLRGDPDPSELVEDCGGGISIRQQDREAAEAVLREILSGPDFQRTMSSAALHAAIGRHLRAQEKNLGVEFPSILTSAHELGVPIFNPSAADNLLGSLIADLAEAGNRLVLDPIRDLNQAAAILNGTGTAGNGGAVLCLGRGAAANFVLGVPAHLRRILGDSARAPYESCIRLAGRAHMDPSARAQRIPEVEAADVPCERRGDEPLIDLAISTDLSVTFPILTAYILDRAAPRAPKRLGEQRADLMDQLRQDHLQATLKRSI
ncbi:MAG: deoxyhypusine synthase family protein [Candidatus Eisenbacteria sp.]|nr:deoxyhypusine synthase family protein [Candidatus Eisenbacteria bacterium]